MIATLIKYSDFSY